MLRLASLVASGLVLAGPAAAQEPVRDDIRATFDAFEDALRENGLTPYINREIETALAAGATQTEYLTLIAGRTYGVRGMCDGDCTDLDLVLQDPQGRTVGSDTLDDPQPSITVEDVAGGRYQLTIRMISCSIEPCLVGVRAYHIE